MAIIENPVFWVAVAFLIFLALLIWFKVPTMLASGLDQHSKKIKDELDEARNLKEEAKALLAQIQRKHHEAKSEAEAMIEQSKEEAGLFASDIEAELKAFFERQERTIGEKIDQAEADAVKEVQTAAVEVAIRAARKVLKKELSGEAGQLLTEKAINDLEDTLSH